MSISGGASQFPATVLPHDSEAKRDFEVGHRFSTGLVATLLVILVGASLFCVLWLMWAGFWYLGLGLLAAVGVAFVLVRNR